MTTTKNAAAVSELDAARATHLAAARDLATARARQRAAPTTRNGAAVQDAASKRWRARCAHEVELTKVGIW